MSSATNKPVVIFGVSGYTGRLVAELLREYHMPFIRARAEAGADGQRRVSRRWRPSSM